MKKVIPRIFQISLIILLVFSLFTPYTFSNKSFADTNKEWIELEVENGDFEKTPTTETDLPSWDLWTGGLKEGMTITDEFAFEGERSLKIDNQGVIGIFSQAIEVTEGTEYRLSAQLYVEELASGAHGPGIWLRWYNDEGVNIADDPNYFRNISLNQWEEVSIIANAPTNATTLKVFIYQTSNTLMKGYYDKIQLFEKSPDFEKPKDWKKLAVENGDFEKTPASDSDIPFWSFWGSGSKEGARISQDFAYEGNQSLEIDNNSAIGLESQKVNVTSGNIYKITAKLYVEEVTSGAPGLWFRWFDKDGKHIGEDSNTFKDLPIEEWNELEIEARAPNGAKQLQVFIYQSSTTVIKGYYDDIELFEMEPDELKLDFEYGAPINLGPGALAGRTQGTAIGEDEIYFASSGSPATFYAIDAKTGEANFSAPLSGSDVVWGLTLASDGNVYFSGTYNGILYRYVVDEKRLEQVGKIPSDNWVWGLEASEDGKVYGVTYPNAKAFEYDIEADQFTDLGSFHDTQQYARGLGVTEENLYVGIGTQSAHLIKMNRKTKEKTEINLPITGTETAIANIWEYGNNLFVGYGTSFFTLDAETGKVLNHIHRFDDDAYDHVIAPPSPYDENIIYYRNQHSEDLWIYHADTHETEPVEPQIHIPHQTAAFEWTKAEDGTDVLTIFQKRLESLVYSPLTGEIVDSMQADVELQGLNIGSIEMSEDGKLYIGGMSGSFGVYDTITEEYILREQEPFQIEGVGFLNGDVYLGAYGEARIYKYDPDLPYHYVKGGEGDNPKMVYATPDAQDRPFTFTSGDDKLFIGTLPGYGLLGGSLTIYDSITDEWESIPNFINNQSINGLAFQNGIVYGGTTIEGGLGIQPTEERAKMFAYDTSSGEHDVFDLVVEGLKTPTFIGELSVGPDNNLWGIAGGLNDIGQSNTVIFAMDPDTNEIIKSTELYTGKSISSAHKPFYLRWDDQGLLYSNAARYPTVTDPETMKSKQLLSNTVSSMEVDSQSNVYYAIGPDLYKLPSSREIPEQEIPSINEVEKFADLQVDFRTDKDHLALPKTVTVTLSDDTTLDVPVTWNNGDPEYDGNTPGAYTFTGELDLSSLPDVINPDNLTATIIVTVKDPVVTLDSLQDQIEELYEKEQIPHSLYKKISNQLKQVRHHEDNGRSDQAKHHLNVMKKHVEKWQPINGDSIKQLLIDNIDLLIE